MPILHVAVHTILSQSSSLWEPLPQMIGFAGRLGFWGPHGREGLPPPLLCVCALLAVLFLTLLRPPRETRVSFSFPLPAVRGVSELSVRPSVRPSFCPARLLFCAKRVSVCACVCMCISLALLCGYFSRVSRRQTHRGCKMKDDRVPLRGRGMTD